MLDDAYVVVWPSGETDTGPAVGGRPDVELGKLKPNDLPRRLSEDLYGTDLDED